MVCVDADGRTPVVNAQPERLFGNGQGQLFGQPMDNAPPLFVPDAGARCPSHHRQDTCRPSPRPSGPPGWELPVAAATATTFPLEISLYAIDTEQGILLLSARGSET